LFGRPSFWPVAIAHTGGKAKLGLFAKGWLKREGEGNDAYTPESVAWETFGLSDADEFWSVARGFWGLHADFSAAHRRERSIHLSFAGACGAEVLEKIAPFSGEDLASLELQFSDIAVLKSKGAGGRAFTLEGVGVKEFLRSLGLLIELRG